MEHQDWTEVKFDKRGKKQATETNKEFIKRQEKTGILHTVIKPLSNKVEKVVNARKLEEESEYFKHKTVPMSIAKNISQKRCEKKLSQKQLANLLALPENLIRDYEKINSKIIPNPVVLNKIEKILGRVRD